MESRTSWSDRPLWVRIGLFGIQSREAALLWMKGSLALVFVTAIAIAVAPFLLLGVGIPAAVISAFAVLVCVPVMLISPLWYWIVIQWVDEHDGWDRVAAR
jgi:hypothetical protein